MSTERSTVSTSVTGPALPSLLGRVHLALSELRGRPPEIDDRHLDAFTLAVAEVVGNQIRHRHRANVTVELHLKTTPDALVAVSTDDDVEVVLPDTPTDPRAALAAVPVEDTSGRGLALARSVAEVTLTRDGDHNVWRITRARTSS